MSEESKEEKEVIETTAKKQIEIAADHGQIIPANLTEEMRYCSMLATSNMIPQRFQGKPADILVARQTAIELGLKPITALRQIAVIKGTPTIFGDLPAALCWQSGKLVRLTEYFLDKDGKKTDDNQKAFKAYCEAERNTGGVTSVTFSMDDAKKANLLKNPTWQSYHYDMLRYRARGRVLKSLFADCLNGMAIAEYDHGVDPSREVLDSRSESEKTQDLTQRLNGENTVNLEDV